LFRKSERILINVSEEESLAETKRNLCQKYQIEKDCVIAALINTTSYRIQQVYHKNEGDKNTATILKNCSGEGNLLAFY
jgi:hypothetical protein